MLCWIVLLGFCAIVAAVPILFNTLTRVAVLLFELKWIAVILTMIAAAAAASH